MKKLFTLFLAFAFIFLTSCNHAPSVATTNSGSTGNEVTNPQEDWDAHLKDKIVMNMLRDFIELPSRILFEANIGGQIRTYYYSKTDGKAYVYCFDPICDHTDYTCLGNPDYHLSGWNFSSTFFINNRFYSISQYGQIWSFAFDGSDKRIEYDAGYELPDGIIHTMWSSTIAYGPYIYITLNLDADGNRHNLRYNIETKEMEDLTEKTGNIIALHYIYNDVIYGKGDVKKMGGVYLKTDLDLNPIEVNENPTASGYAVDHLIIEKALGDLDPIFGLPKLIGLRIYDIKTGESFLIKNEDLGVKSVEIAGVTEKYIYFFDNQSVNLGTITVNIFGTDREIKVTKANNGKLYRMNLDGTNIVCVYNNPEYELDSDMVIYDDKIVMQGRYIKVENGEKKIWGGPVQAATINPDGTFGEFMEVEVLQ